jgi:transmembrane sensor
LDQHYDIPLEDLLVKYLLQEATPEERRAVDEWLAADAEHRQYYDQLYLIWEKSRLLAMGGDLPDIPGEEEQAWQTLRQKMQKPGRDATILRTGARRMPLRTLRFTAAAAAILLFFFWWQHTTPNWQSTASNDHIRIDTLTDGSIVTLNKHSILSQPPTFAASARTVTLEGEAFFNIAADKNRPFRIKTNGISITVLGTSFNVRTENGKTTILVETGLVEVENRQNRIHIAAGETITLGQNDPSPVKQPARESLYKYYQPRDFVCRDTPLGALVDALNQAYGDSIMIKNPAIRGLPITTAFHDASLPQILDVIRKTLNISVQDSASRYVLQ